MDAHDLTRPLVAPRATSIWAATARRTLDLVAAALLLLVLAPLLMGIVVAIRLDTRGKALFRQRRMGRDGEPFTLMKFRTMREAADPARHRDYVRQLIVEDVQTQVHGERGLYKLAVDDRITAVGRVLRKWS